MQNYAIHKLCACLLLPAALCLNSVQAAPDKKEPAPATIKGDKAISLSTTEEKVSYAIGVNMGESLRQQDIRVNMDAFIGGFKDVMLKNTPQMTEAEMQKTLTTFQETQRKAFEEKMKVSAVKNASEGKAFLEANKMKPGVITLATGLQYKITEEGKGESPKDGDTVTVNYRGTLVDGTEFDSSAKHGQAATFQVDRVIAGWTQALKLMKPGAKWTIYLPPTLAYGEAGAGRAIGPNATLIFDVELLSVKAGEAPKAADQTKKAEQKS